ncbi:hypothetical protein ACFWY6_17200 [Streptomyces sp. NPDC059037]|uniref:hypothetical protein n=1 Tax=Streptomyces sp. NPDC059037 TaxID=3346710 RepID=UPI0036C3E617
MDETQISLTAPAAEFVGHLVQGSPEERDWRSRSIAPSDIGAVMDRSPFQTREDLLKRKAAGGSRPPLRNPPVQGLGWDKQPDLAEEFTDAHPEYEAVTTSYWRNRDREWQRCWPHRALIPTDHDAAQGPATINATLTFRTTPRPLDEKGWGPGGSTVPAHIYDETQWLLDTLGTEHAYVIAYSKHGDETRTYRIARDDEHIATLRAASEAFLRELIAGEET